MRLRRIAPAALVALAAIVTARVAVGATSFDVTNSGASAYVINGTNNATLTLTRGQTYTFAMNASGHPFWIATGRGSGDTESRAFSTGVTSNGSDTGTITFAVPASAPPKLFYQCVFHDPMGGTLDIVNPPGVPSIGPAMLAGLALLLFFVAVRRRSLTRP